MGEPESINMQNNTKVSKKYRNSSKNRLNNIINNQISGQKGLSSTWIK